MTIVIVRHGETAGNAARVLQLPDVPLNDVELVRRNSLHGACSITASHTSSAAIWCVRA
jgi:broad specificity phosphatase PhoE